VSFDDYARFASASGRGLPSDNGWGRGNRPVININWEDASAYTRWLSEQTGHHYRLPSEAEWEYAAAAGTNTFYPWGNNGGENHAVCFNCGSRWDARQTAPAGSFAANAFGLYDMAGNVLEWVADCRHDSYQDAPGDGGVWAGGDCGRHMARGGAYDSPVDNLRTQSRPYFATGTRLNNLGLRVVRQD
jgi:formylglycine-generating enzyme required for sulfatase activity